MPGRGYAGSNPRAEILDEGDELSVGLQPHVQARVLAISVDSEGGDHGDEGIDS